MLKISSAAFGEVEQALRQYLRDVEGADLKPLTKKTYTLHAENFVRWLRNDFDPGARKAGEKRR